MSRRLLCVLLSAIAFAGVARAQTNQPYFRSWPWEKEPSAARAAGMAGAMTAVGDDGSSAEANPASLTSLKKSEVTFTMLTSGKGRSVYDDALLSRTQVGYIGLAGRLSWRWAVGGYVIEPQAARVELGGRERGFLNGVFRDAGASAAFRATSKLHVGVRLTATRLRIDGQSTSQIEPQSDAFRAISGGPTTIRIDTGGSDTRVAVSVGASFDATPKIRIGVVRLNGARYSVGTAATAELRSAGGALTDAIVLDPGSDYEILQPSLVSGGLSIRLSPKLLIAGQLDYLRYGQVPIENLSRLPGYSGVRFDLHAWERRLGAELSLPFRHSSLQLRGGVHWRSPDPLAYSSLAPTVVPAALQTPESFSGRSLEFANFVRSVSTLSPPVPVKREARFIFSAGASLVASNGFRFDVAARLGGERSAFLVGTSVRF